MKNSDIIQMFSPDSNNKFNILIVGLGGLGSPVAVSVSGLKIGVIRLCDFDTVSKTNLNRQFLYGEKDIGKKKSQCAKEFLENFSSVNEYFSIDEKVTRNNAERLIKNCDLVICTTDNNETRLALNKACYNSHIPIISAGVEGMCGQVIACDGLFAPCLQCFIDEKSQSKSVATTCASCEIIGGFASCMAMRVLLGDKSVFGNLAIIDTLYNTVDILPIKKNMNCTICNKSTEVL